MAAYDNVDLPGAPRPPNYAAPIVDFSKLGNLVSNYQQGQQYARTRALQTAFQNGLPTDPNTGQIDYNQIAQTLARLGGAESVSQILPTLMTQQQGQGASDAIGNAGRFVSGPSAATGNPAPDSAPPSSVRPSSDAHMPATNAGPGSITGQQPGYMLPNREMILGSEAPEVAASGTANAGPSPAPFMGGSSPNIQPRQFAQNDVTQTTANGRLPNGYNEDTARRYEQAGDYLSQQAARAAAAKNQELSQSLEKAAQSKYDSAKQIRDVIGKNVELTPEQKNLQSGAAAQTQVQKQRIEASDKTYLGLRGLETQYLQNTQPAIQTAKGIISNPKMWSGWGADLALDFNKLRAQFGGDPEPAALQEALTKITAINTLSQFAQQRAELEEQGQASGRIFQAQVENIQKASANLQNTPRGNLFLVNYQDRLGKFQANLAQQARDYRAMHNGVLDDGFDQQIAGYMKKNPIFTPQEQANPMLLAAPDAPATLRSKDAVMRWATAMNLQHGDAFRTPKGDIRYVP